MKNPVLLLCLLFAINSHVAYSQDKPDYFLGKWDVLVQGLPQGDAKFTIAFEETDGKLSGKMIDKEAKETPFTSVELGENAIRANFTAQGFDVYIKLSKAENDTVTGTMMDMFNASGTRIK